MSFAQSFLVLSLWTCCMVVPPMKKARWRSGMDMEGVAVIEEWVLHDKDNGAHSRSSGSGGLSGPWTLKVLRSFDEDYLLRRKLVDCHVQSGARRSYVKPRTATLYGDLD
ncbi:hypothetical protein DAEQUDRAFT_763111 [Daedalea quercina L-15889]|uniref:Protein kinase domain-containing protein n=1 Tax=Daedalea quercina L-15889 TaxID=1314783 RepID=A0A165SRX5_9APHY|nr:hypothetical protein DAEQUDRAFT_763111 [Daedalea quercina L-15889]